MSSAAAAARWKKGWRYALVRILRLLALLYLGLLLFGWLGSEGMIFLPQPASYRDDAAIRKIPVPRDGRTISALWITNATARFTLLFSHGNAEDLGDLRPFLNELAASGFDVLAYDYAGYGTSGGKPSEHAAYEDVDAAFCYLTNTLGRNASRVIVMGRSVGSGPSVYLASRTAVAGLILDSGFTSAFRVMTHARIAPFDRFDNVARIRRVSAPILLIHGTADRTIPPWHARSLYAAAPSTVQLVWIEGADHNDLVATAGPRYFEILRDFAASR